MSSESQRKYSIRDAVRQSPPLDFSSSIDDTWVKDKTILITGGASGFGEGFFKRWAALGANVVIGDVDVAKGDQLVRDVSRETGNKNLYFFYCDVTNWQSQVDIFKSAVRVSPHAGIDCVVANAGIVDTEGKFELPQGLDGKDPPPPSLKVIDVNLTGVLYTTHLALFFLSHNPGSQPASPTANAAEIQRDRHILLIGSTASLAPIPAQALYTVSKHAVIGLYRSLRSTSFLHGIRANMLCPYYVETPLLSLASRLALAGIPKAKLEDVIGAATRFVADPRIAGRAVVIGPTMKVQQDSEGQWELAEGPNVEEKGVLEVFVNDFDEAEPSTRKIVALINSAAEKRGWSGWLVDVIGAFRYRLGL